MNQTSLTPPAADNVDPTGLIGRIRFLIGRLNITQGEFARRIGVDPTNFSKILNGRLRITYTRATGSSMKLCLSSEQQE